MGKPRDPEYWRKWRAAHPEYRARQLQRVRVHHTAGERRKSRALPPLPPIFPEYPQYRLSYWTQELQLDLRQEAALAKLEGIDPKVACRQYRAREMKWRRMTTWLPPDD